MAEIAEWSDLDIERNYKMSDLDDIDLEELKASAIPWTSVVSTQIQEVEAVNMQIQKAYELSCEAKSLRG